MAIRTVTHKEGENKRLTWSMKLACRRQREEIVFFTSSRRESESSNRIQRLQGFDDRRRQVNTVGQPTESVELGERVKYLL